MSVGYYIIIHILLSIIATNSSLKRIDEGKVSDKLKEKIAKAQITFLQIAHGNPDNAQTLFILSILASNLLLFSYVFRFLNILKPIKNDSE